MLSVGSLVYNETSSGYVTSIPATKVYITLNDEFETKLRISRCIFDKEWLLMKEINHSDITSSGYVSIEISLALPKNNRKILKVKGATVTDKKGESFPIVAFSRLLSYCILNVDSPSTDRKFSRSLMVSSIKLIKQGHSYAELSCSIPQQLFDAIARIEMPILTMTSMKRSTTGNLWRPSQTNIQRRHLVFVFIDAIEGIGVNGRHPYIRILKGEETHWTIMLPSSGAGIRCARQTIKLFMEALMVDWRYRPGSNLLRNSEVNGADFDMYYMLDDDIKAFRMYDPLRNTNLNISAERALIYLWITILAPAVRVPYVDPTTGLMISPAGADADACIVGSTPGKSMRGNYYAESSNYTHRRCSRAEQVVLLSRRRTQSANYADDALMSNSEKEWRLLFMRRKDMPEWERRYYFQGEDWQLNGHLLQNDLFPFMALRLSHTSLDLASENQTIS